MLKILQQYTLTRLIGSGAYGKVYQSTHSNLTKYAIKQIPLTIISQNPKLLQLFKQQIQILSTQNNPNIIKFIQIIKSTRYLYIIYEYCDQTLQEYLKRKGGRLDEKQAIRIFKQLINAYSTLYEYSILHRDIKTDNILIQNGVIKLADFGFCKRLKSKDDLTQTSLGSPLYMAPQVLNQDIYGSKADLWSCGIVLYQMLFGSCPFNTSNISDLLSFYKNKRSIEYPSKWFISSQLKQMLSRMLQKDQFKRINWQEFFYQYNFTQNNQVLHKQKDFQYDLMQLIKRNSKDQQRKLITQNGYKFDWTKINDITSSVHSEDCRNILDSKGQDFNATVIFAIKKKVKHFQNQHTKIVELISIIQLTIESQKCCLYDSKIVYFMVYNLSNMLNGNINKIQQYIIKEQKLLSSFLQQRNHLQRLSQTLKQQLSQISFLLNSVKLTLLNQSQTCQQIRKYPNSRILRKYMKQYVQNYKDQIQLVHQLNQQVYNKSQIILFVKILWAISLIIKDDVLLNINKDIKTRQLSLLITKYLIRISV